MPSTLLDNLVRIRLGITALDDEILQTGIRPDVRTIAVGDDIAVKVFGSLDDVAILALDIAQLSEIAATENMPSRRS